MQTNPCAIFSCEMLVLKAALTCRGREEWGGGVRWCHPVRVYQMPALRLKLKPARVEMERSPSKGIPGGFPFQHPVQTLSDEKACASKCYNLLGLIWPYWPRFTLLAGQNWVSRTSCGCCLQDSRHSCPLRRNNQIVWELHSTCWWQLSWKYQYCLMPIKLQDLLLLLKRVLGIFSLTLLVIRVYDLSM